MSEKWAKDLEKDARKFLNDFVLSGSADDEKRKSEDGAPDEATVGVGVGSPGSDQDISVLGWLKEAARKLEDDVSEVRSREKGGLTDAQKRSADEGSFLDRLKGAIDEQIDQVISGEKCIGKGNDADKRSSAPDISRREGGGFSLLKTFSAFASGGGDEESVKVLINRAREAIGDTGDAAEERSLAEVGRVLSDVGRTLDTSFGHLDLTQIDPTAVFYYLEAEDERKNPSWKRRMHRFRKGVDLRHVTELNDALDLAHLSYADSVDDIREGLMHTLDPWELVYCQTESQPGEPGHFVALKKGQSRWSATLDVLLVVRGTKTVTDLLTDALMEPVDYRGGKAHNGIVESGRFLVNKHTKLLKNLRDLSGKRKINLTIVGHSLGAAAASIAGMEFRDDPSIDVNVVGFGCPALLSRDLSEGAREYITTVVGDADVVPRCSSATIANLALDLMEYDWTERGRRDVRQALDEMREWSSYKIIGQDDVDFVMKAVDAIVDKSITPGLKEKTLERVEPVLFPPGRCVHFYRDGSGISGSYVPCTFFGEIDLARTMVDDHTTKGGYGKIFLELMRQFHRNEHFTFEKGQTKGDR